MRFWIEKLSNRRRKIPEKYSGRGDLKKMILCDLYIVIDIKIKKVVE